MTKFLDTVNNRLEVEATDDDIKDLYRLNRNNIDDDRPAPLMITVKDIKLKDEIFKNVRKLRGDKSISFDYDLTPLEREDKKRLIEKAKYMTKNDQEGVMYRVRGPPWAKTIVKVTMKEVITEPIPINLEAIKSPTKTSKAD